MYSESMYILVTLILGCVSLLYGINFSLHSFLVPYVTLDHLVTRIVRIFFFSDLTKGPHNYHLWNIWLYEVRAEPGLRGQQGDDHIQDNKAAHFLLWGGTKVKDVSGQVLCLFVVCGLFLMTSAVTLVIAKFNFP